MATVITGTGPAQLRALAIRLHAADPMLKRELRTRLRDAAGPAARAVQASIQEMPAHTEEGLRAEVAATVAVVTSVRQNSVNVSIVSYGTRMPPGKGSLPKHLDSRAGWSHPVYGHRDRWVRQFGKPQWFENPVISDFDRLQHAAAQAVDDTARMLAG